MIGLLLAQIGFVVGALLLVVTIGLSLQHPAEAAVVVLLAAALLVWRDRRKAREHRQQALYRAVAHDQLEDLIKRRRDEFRRSLSPDTRAMLERSDEVRERLEFEVMLRRSGLTPPPPPTTLDDDEEDDWL